MAVGPTPLMASRTGSRKPGVAPPSWSRRLPCRQSDGAAKRRTATTGTHP